jgi:hypothetical protein
VTGSLWFRLDVSQYYVIRTIIILDASVGGMGSWSFQKDDATSMQIAGLGINRQEVESLLSSPCHPGESL